MFFWISECRQAKCFYPVFVMFLCGIGLGADRSGGVPELGSGLKPNQAREQGNEKSAEAVGCCDAVFSFHVTHFLVKLSFCLGYA